MNFTIETSEPQYGSDMFKHGSGAQTPEEIKFLADWIKWFNAYPARDEDLYAAVHQIYEQLPAHFVGFLWGYVQRYHSGYTKHLMDAVNQMQVELHKAQVAIGELTAKNRQLAYQKVENLPTTENPYSDLPHHYGLLVTKQNNKNLERRKKYFPQLEEKKP